MTHAQRQMEASSPPPHSWAVARRAAVVTADTDADGSVVGDGDLGMFCRGEKIDVFVANPTSSIRVSNIVQTPPNTIQSYP